MGITLANFQLKAIEALMEAMGEPNRDIILKSCTGSGKTIILTHFMDEYLKSTNKAVFVWLTPGKGNLELQSKAKMDKYIHGSNTKLLSDIMSSGFEENDACFINWEKLTKKGNNALKDSERTNFVEHIQNAIDNGLTFTIIVDESHQNDTIKADDILALFNANKIILAFYEKELERVKPTTVKHYHALIHGALNYAVDKNLIPSNPADRIIISKPEPFKGDYYLDSEVLNLFEVIKGHKIELVVLLTAFYGLRRSEVIGLKWSAFDFNHNCFSIRHTVTTCNVKGERVTIKKDKAKNKSSLRTYPLIPFLKERLLEAKKQQEENRKLCGRAYNKEYLGYVCVDVIGNLIKPNYVSSTFGKLLAKNNLRHIRFHDLRHTCASLLLANGVPMEQVKEWLGHSEISTTVDIYGHLQYATKKQSAAAIEQDIVAPMLQNLSAVSP